jgi:hypothetical protein
MNMKTTAILFGLLCGFFLVFFLFQKLGVKTPTARQAESRQVLPSLRVLVKKNEPNFDDPVNPVNVASDAKYKLFDRITLERAATDKQPAETIEFRKQQGSKWKITAPREVRTDTQAVWKLIDQMAYAERESLKELPSNLAEYGLDKPNFTVRLYKGDEVFWLKIGKPGPMYKDATTQQERPLYYYVVSSDLPTSPTTVKTSTIEQLVAPLNAFREHKVFSSAFNIKEMTLGGTQRQPITLAAIMEGRTPQPSRWEFRQPRLGDADLTTVTNITREVAGLRIEKDEDFLQDGASDTELAKYGLAKEKLEYFLLNIFGLADQLPKITLRLQAGMGTEKEEKGETLLIGKPVPCTLAEISLWHGAVLASQYPAGVLSLTGDPFALLGAVASLPQGASLHHGYYARLEDSTSVFRVEDRIVPPLKKSVDDLRSRALAKLNLGKLDAIDIASGADTLHLRRQVMTPNGTAPSDWDIYRPGKPLLKADTKAVAELIDAINRIDVKDPKHFLDDEARQQAYQKEYLGQEKLNLGFDKPQAVITLWEEGIERNPEGIIITKEPAFKKDAKPAVKLTLGNRDERFGILYVKREAANQDTVILAIKDRWFGAPATTAPHPGMDQQQFNFSLSELAAGGRLHYRDHTLPHLLADQVENFTVERDGMKYVLERAFKPEPGKPPLEDWKLTQPVTANSPNGPLFLSFLGQIHAKVLLSDEATAAQWEQHGLGTKPWMKITQQSFADDKQKRDELTIFIGKKTDAKDKHPDHYYTRIEFKPKDGKPVEANSFLFLLPAEVAKSLDVELRDTTIFPRAQYTSFFPRPQEGQVQLEQATLTWNTIDQEKKPHTLKLTLAPVTDKAGKRTWTIQSLTDNGADAKARLPQVDGNKVAHLFNDGTDIPSGLPGLLNPLQALFFLQHNGQPKPEERLDPNSKNQPPPLIVELKLSNQITRTLRLGAEYTAKEEEHPYHAGKTFRLAWASSLPNAVFVVSPQGFTELLQGPEFFKPVVPGVPGKS